MTDPLQRTPAEARAGLHGVVVDANALSKGRLNLGTLRDWAQMLQSVSLALWLPEPVAWELAEHAVREYVAAHARFRSARRWLADTGLDVVEWPERGSDDLLQDCLTKIRGAHTNLHVLLLHDQDAAQALRDQVLLRPPAKRKGGTDKDPGVKTGAADIAAVRLLQRHAPDASTYVVLGQDQDWVDAYRVNGWGEPVFYPNWRNLRQALFSVVSAVGTGPAVVSYLVNAFIEDGATRLGSVMGGGALFGVDEDPSAVVVRSVEVEDIAALAGVTHLETFEETDEVAATVFLLARLGVTTQRYNEADGGWTSEYEVQHGALLRGSLTFTLEEDVLVGAIAGSDEPFRVLREERYADAEDAFEAALAALRCVPGLEDLDWPAAYDSTEDGWGGELANGRLVEIRVDGSPYADWSMEVALVDGEEAPLTLRCEFDDDAWVGGSEGMFIDPPWRLFGEDRWSRHPEWRLTADLIDRAAFVA